MNIKDLTRALHGHFSKNELDLVLQMASDDVSVTANAIGMTFNGKEGFAGFMQGFKNAVPDIKIEYSRMISEGDTVAVEFVATGSNTGSFITPMGIFPPTGNPVNLKVVEFLTWENGRLKSIQNYQDSSALMKQLGVM